MGRSVTDALAMSGASPGWLGRVLRAWSADLPRSVARALVLIACALLFLNAAATFEIVYTLRVSYLCLAAACAIGFPFVVLGWRRMSRPIRVSACLVALAYVVSALFGVGDSLGEGGRGGSQRELVFLVDLVLGFGTIGLVAGLFGGEKENVRPAVAALLLGGLVGAAYGVVQWPARRFDWSIANINNALNPDAVTRGEVPQGTGLLLGWERVRGTFTEPLFFGLYLSTVLPLIIAWLEPRRRRLAACAGAAALIGFALLLTSSFPAWSIAAAALLSCLLLFSIARGTVLAAAAAGGTLVASAVVVSLVLFGSPVVFERVTGRSAGERELTSLSRTDAWEKAARNWAERPLIGHGPGQTGVQLARRQEGPDGSTRVVLGSAQGLLPASLIDIGLIGVWFWIGFLSACLAVVATTLWRRPTLLHLALSASILAALLGTMFSGDRIELQTWLVLGIGLAAMATRPAAPKRSTGAPPIAWRRPDLGGHRLAKFLVVGLAVVGATVGALAGADPRPAGESAQVSMGVDLSWEGIEGQPDLAHLRLGYVASFIDHPAVRRAVRSAREPRGRALVAPQVTLAEGEPLRFSTIEADRQTALDVAQALATVTSDQARASLQVVGPRTRRIASDGAGWTTVAPRAARLDSLTGDAREGSSYLQIRCRVAARCAAYLYLGRSFEGGRRTRLISAYARAPEGRPQVTLGVSPAGLPSIDGEPVEVGPDWTRVTVRWRPRDPMTAASLTVTPIGAEAGDTIDVDDVTIKGPSQNFRPLPAGLDRDAEVTASSLDEYVVLAEAELTGATGVVPVKETIGGAAAGLLVALVAVLAGAAAARRRVSGFSDLRAANRSRRG